MLKHVETAEPWLVYDGQCPFCSRYVKLLRVRQAVGKLTLVNAREGGPLVDEVIREGFDLDDGMVLRMDGRFYHGDECIHRLALLSTPSRLFNRINRAIFRSARASRLLYPVLRVGRNATLRLLNRKKISQSEL